MNKNDFPSAGKALNQQTNASGATYNTITAAACIFARVHNPNSVTIDVRRVGDSTSIVTVPALGSKTFYGIGNTNELEFRRTDVSNTQVSIQVEAYS